ncbi:Hypothetical protein UVM_LOCUS256 [uncultured virus]|nr:Hypothetical protein UVM_LOCUS256 [uncultured virus]
MTRPNSTALIPSISTDAMAESLSLDAWAHVFRWLPFRRHCTTMLRVSGWWSAFYLASHPPIAGARLGAWGTCTRAAHDDDAGAERCCVRHCVLESRFGGRLLRTATTISRLQCDLVMDRWYPDESFPPRPTEAHHLRCRYRTGSRASYGQPTPSDGWVAICTKGRQTAKRCVARNRIGWFLEDGTFARHCECAPTLYDSESSALTHLHRISQLCPGDLVEVVLVRYWREDATGKHASAPEHEVVSARVRALNRPLNPSDEPRVGFVANQWQSVGWAQDRNEVRIANGPDELDPEEDDHDEDEDGGIDEYGQALQADDDEEDEDSDDSSDDLDMDSSFDSEDASTTYAAWIEEAWENGSEASVPSCVLAGTFAESVYVCVFT